MFSLFGRAHPQPGGYRELEPNGVAGMVGKVRIVDVREPHELTSELGHIAGSESVPLATIEAASRAWDKDDEIVLVCRSGGRSGRAAAALAALGFRRLINMSGGMLAWNAAKLPIER